MRRLWVVVSLLVFLYTPAWADEAYIDRLDMTLATDGEGLRIVEIGPFSPFRRYSLFRRGDVLIEVGGELATFQTLSALPPDVDAWVLFKTLEGYRVVQINLRLNIFFLPGWLR